MEPEQETTLTESAVESAPISKKGCRNKKKVGVSSHKLKLAEEPPEPDDALLHSAVIKTSSIEIIVCDTKEDD